MTKKVAIFSDGTRDVYNGTRDVKAAWQVTLPDGGKFSGHSLDRNKAAQTARGHAASRCEWWPLDKGRNGPRTLPYLKYIHEQAVKLGFKDAKAHDAHATKARAEFVASCKIEIVDVD